MMFIIFGFFLVMNVHQLAWGAESSGLVVGGEDADKSSFEIRRAYRAHTGFRWEEASSEDREEFFKDYNRQKYLEQRHEMKKVKREVKKEQRDDREEVKYKRKLEKRKKKRLRVEMLEERDDKKRKQRLDKNMQKQKKKMQKLRKQSQRRHK